MFLNKVIDLFGITITPYYQDVKLVEYELVINKYLFMELK